MDSYLDTIQGDGTDLGTGGGGKIDVIPKLDQDTFTGQEPGSGIKVGTGPSVDQKQDTSTGGTTLADIAPVLGIDSMQGTQPKGPGVIPPKINPVPPGVIPINTIKIDVLTPPKIKDEEDEGLKIGPKITPKITPIITPIIKPKLGQQLQPRLDLIQKPKFEEKLKIDFLPVKPRPKPVKFRPAPLPKFSYSPQIGTPPRRVAIPIGRPTHRGTTERKIKPKKQKRSLWYWRSNVNVASVGKYHDGPAYSVSKKRKVWSKYDKKEKNHWGYNMQFGLPRRGIGKKQKSKKGLFRF